MKVNTQDLQNEIHHLNLLIKEWKNTQLNLYNQMDQAFTHWKDNSSVDFEEKIYLEKNNVEQVVKKVKDIKDIYQYLYNRYNKLGDKILCDVESRKDLITRIEIYYENLKKIYNQFDNIDLSVLSDEKEKIATVKNKLKIQLKNLTELKDKVLAFFDQVEEIEKEMLIRASKIQDVLVEEFDFTI